MKNKSALLKIRKNEIFSYLGNPWRKKMCMQKHFLFLFEELMIQISERSERKMALVVKGLNAI